MKPIYLDHQATTPLDERVLEAMEPYLRSEFGNASSSQHSFGWSAQKGVEAARTQVASLLGAQSREITFTSGATESINWVFFAMMELARTEPVHVISSHVEHSATRAALERAEKWGVEITVLPVDTLGHVRAEQVQAALRPHTRLVSLIHANNEIGTIQELDKIGAVTRAHGAWLHADAAQSAGKVPIDVQTLPVDLISLSGHKMYGPKGIGALWVRAQNPRVRLTPFMTGGGQERGLRGGTLNVAGIVGLGAATHLAQQIMPVEAPRLRDLAQQLQTQLAQTGGVEFNGDPVRRIPGTLSVTFTGVSSATMYPYLQELAVSTGSACASAEAHPSHVLTAIGLTPELARGTFRLSLGRLTTPDDVTATARCFAQAVAKARG